MNQTNHPASSPVKKGNLKLLLIILGSAIILAIIFYYLFILRGSKTVVAPSPSLPSQISATPKANGSPLLTPISNLKTYRNTDLGTTFQYPSSWKDIELQKNTNNYGATNMTTYSNKMSNNDSIYFDPDKAFLFDATYKDSQPFEWPLLNKKKIDVNWTKEQFTQEMSVDQGTILFTKKLSNKSMLLAVYNNAECSPMMQLSVITALNDNYPNLQIIIMTQDFDNDSDLKAYEQQQIAKDGTACDLLQGYQTVANKIANGTFSDKINNYIKTAQQIADSVRAI